MSTALERLLNLITHPLTTHSGTGGIMFSGYLSLQEHMTQMASNCSPWARGANFRYLSYRRGPSFSVSWITMDHVNHGGEFQKWSHVLFITWGQHSFITIACVCMSVCINPKLVQMITPHPLKLEPPNSDKRLVKFPIVLGVDWPLLSRSNLTWKSKFHIMTGLSTRVNIQPPE